MADGRPDTDDVRNDGGHAASSSYDRSLRERLQHVETTQTYLADTQDDIAETQEEILDAVTAVREEMVDPERVDSLETETDHNRRYMAILKWVGSGISVLAGSSVVAWGLGVI